MKKINSQEGQAVIETALVLPLLALIALPAVFGLVHLFAIKIYFQHQLYELLVCKEIRISTVSCENKFRNQSKIILIGSTIKNFYYKKNNSQADAEVILKTWYSKKVKVHEQIQLPLQ